MMKGPRRFRFTLGLITGGALGFLGGAFTFHDVMGYFKGTAKELASEVGRGIATDARWRVVTGCKEKGRQAQVTERTFVALRARRIMLTVRDGSTERIIIYSPERFEWNADFLKRISDKAALYCKDGTAP